MMYIGNMKETDLVLLIRKKDARAMKTLYGRYIGYLTATCSRYIVREDDVKDILQESFIKIFTSLDKFEYRGEGSLKAWMTRIVVNESLKFLKKSKEVDLIQYTWDLPETEDMEEPDINEVPTSVIQEMIQDLPVGYRTVFNLYVFEQKTHKEIAELLNIREDSSASQLHRAKSILAKKIKEYTSVKQDCL